MVETNGQRHAVATGALAAERLAPRAARVAGLFGTAEAARAQLRAAAHVRQFERVLVFSHDTQDAARCAVELGAALGLDGEVMTDAAALFGACDFVVGDGAALRPDWLHAGLHVTLLNSAEGINADVLATADVVAAESASEETLALEDVIGGAVQGRRSEADITICALSAAAPMAVSPDVAQMMNDMSAKIAG